MIDRRQFMQAGVVGVVVAGVAPADLLRTIRMHDGVHPSLAVVDARFGESVRFGQEMERRGVVIHVTRGDVTELWYDTLHARWRERQHAPIAGLTAYAALFCLERLAWDHGMRVVYSATHWTSAGRAHQWPADAAERVMEVGGPRTKTRLVQASTTSAGHRAPAYAGSGRVDQALYSWLIAPRLSA